MCCLLLTRFVALLLLKKNLINYSKNYFEIEMKWPQLFPRRSLKSRKYFCDLIFVLTFSLIFFIWKKLPTDVSCAEKHLKDCLNLVFVDSLIFRISRKFQIRESLCSQKATLRGPGQKVVAFSFFGKIWDQDGELSWYAKVGETEVNL